MAWLEVWGTKSWLCWRENLGKIHSEKSTAEVRKYQSKDCLISVGQVILERQLHKDLCNEITTRTGRCVTLWVRFEFEDALRISIQKSTSLESFFLKHWGHVSELKIVLKLVFFLFTDSWNVQLSYKLLPRELCIASFTWVFLFDHVIRSYCITMKEFIPKKESSLSIKRHSIICQNFDTCCIQYINAVASPWKSLFCNFCTQWFPSGVLSLSCSQKLLNHLWACSQPSRCYKEPLLGLNRLTEETDRRRPYFRTRIILVTSLVRLLIFHACVPGCSRNCSGLFPYLRVQENFV